MMNMSGSLRWRLALAVVLLSFVTAASKSLTARTPTPCCGWDGIASPCQYIYTDWPCPNGNSDCDEGDWCCEGKPHIC